MRNSSVSSFTPYLKTKYTQVKIEGSPCPKKLQLNRYPLPKVSHRKMPPLYVSKTQFLSIHQNQKKLSKIFSVANIEQRQLTSKILSFRENEIDAIIENNDSFNDKYSPTKHKFSHKLIGEVQLPRKFFNSSSNEKLFSQTSLTFRTSTLKFPDSLSKPVRNSNKPSQDTLREYRRKALTSIEHYKRLRIDPTAIPRLKEFLPGKPYGHNKSEDFLTACKEGNIEKVLALLELNKWLAHVFDKSGQTGLHWAIKRKQSQVARVLIQSGIWVDVCDFAGRSPLFLAVMSEDIEMVSLLATFRANAYVKTRAGTSISSLVHDPTINSLMMKKVKRHMDTLVGMDKFNL